MIENPKEKFLQKVAKNVGELAQVLSTRLSSVNRRLIAASQYPEADVQALEKEHDEVLADKKAGDTLCHNILAASQKATETNTEQTVALPLSLPIVRDQLPFLTETALNIFQQNILPRNLSLGEVYRAHQVPRSDVNRRDVVYAEIPGRDNGVKIRYTFRLNPARVNLTPNLVEIHLVFSPPKAPAKPA